MSFSTPKEIAVLAVQAGITKSQSSLQNLMILGFLGGAFIAIGFLLDLHVVAQLPADWGSFGGLLGAMVFPLGLILTIIGGAELLTAAGSFSDSENNENDHSKYVLPDYAALFR